MAESTTSTSSQDTLPAPTTSQRSPLIAGEEWSGLQALDVLRVKFDSFLDALTDEEKLEYVARQSALVQAQKSLERAIQQFTEAFAQQGLAQLRAELKTLSGQDIDPYVTYIHTRYLASSARVRRAPHEQNAIKTARVTLWNAACLNYHGLTGWSYPGNTGIAEASYLDDGVNLTSSEFIALVRRLNLGGQLKGQLEQALRPNGALGVAFMQLANAEFEFALVEALNNPTASRVDRAKYQQVKGALQGRVRWDVVEEMLMLIPHGADNVSWLPVTQGLTGQYVRKPPGDSLSIPHIVFSVSDCKGAFSFFPNRPGGSLRHHDSFREACEEFHVAFHGFYSRGKVDWLYRVMSLRDCARVTQLAKGSRRPADLNKVAEFIYDVWEWLPKVNWAQKIGYVRNVVQQVPVLSLSEIYLKRCRSNLQELAHETPGFMPAMIQVFETVLNEILNVLLIPVPGVLRGLGRVRAFAMFVVLGQGLVEGGYRALRGEPGDLLQAFADLADLLVSGRLHSRLAVNVQRRHQRLFQQLSQKPIPAQSLAHPQLIERMLGTQDASAREVAGLLGSSNTSRQTLNQVWEGAPPSASLVEAAQRFTADRLIDWVAEGADPARPSPMGAFEVMAPLLTQLDSWPLDTALRIDNQQGQELRRYSKNAARPATEVVTVTALDNYQFGYAAPRRLTPHFPQAIAALLPSIFSGLEQTLRQQLAHQAKALKLDLFVALTQFAEASRSAAKGASASVLRLLPDNLHSDQPVPAVIVQLQTMHPELSQARVIEVLRDHPLSDHQQTQLLESQLQPQALYQALRAARQVTRREAIIDGLFYPRRFNRQTLHWAAQFAHAVLRDGLGRALVVSPAGPGLPSVPRAAGAQPVVVIDQLRGQFAPFDVREQRRGAVLTGADSFYEAIVSQLSAQDRTRLGLTAQQAIAEFRSQTAHAMLRNRAPDGRFFPYRREIAQYAHEVDASRIASAPDLLGFYHLGEERYLFIEGEYFKVVQADASLPWRVEHPLLNDAYAPVLTHNGAGAWRHEWENPLTWDGQRPFYRLGPLVRGLSPDAITQVQQISGVTADVLRRVHMRNEPPPVMLVSTLERFNIHQRVKAGVATGADFYDRLLGEVDPHTADALVGLPGVDRPDQVEVLASKVALDAPQMERLFFRALAHKSELSRDPLAQVIQRQFPGLTALFADDCVKSATPGERQSLEAGRVPPGVTEAASWYIRYLRMTRALEGLHWSGAVNADSSRLILHSVARLPGWPADLRLEVWSDGERVDSIGPADAPVRRILKTVSEDYQAYLWQGDDDLHPTGKRGPFLHVLLAALTPAERQALGYDYDFGADVLLGEIASRVEHQFERAETLHGLIHQPWFKPPRRLADGRIGYPLSGGDEFGPVDREHIARMRQLFPSSTDQQVFEMLENLSDSVREREVAIDHLFNERDALNLNLDRWCQLAKPEDLLAQREASERIRRCWRREDSTRGALFELFLDDLGLSDLPQMDAHFGHVMQLSLRSNRLQALPTQMLRRFPALRTLFLDGNQLEHVPQGLAEMQHLTHLTLSNNRIKPNLWDVRRLESLRRLVKLDLSYNPLGWGQRLKLYGLTALKILNLRSTRIDLLPSGAVTLQALKTFDLRDNRINVLTEFDLGLNENVHAAMDLHGNSLSQATLQILSRYRRRPGYQNVHFGLWHGGDAPLPSVDRWLAVLPLDRVPQHRTLWSLLAGKQTAQNFFKLLWNLASYPPLIALEFQALRQDITRRVWGLIESAAPSARLERILLEAPLRYMDGRIDGWLLCLNYLELEVLPAQMLAAGDQATGADFLNYFRARRRIESLTLQIVREHPFHSGLEQCAYLLACQIALAQTLDLPVPLTMRFPAPPLTLDPQSLSQYRTRIVQEDDQIDWPGRLADEEYWVEFLERKYPQSFNLALSGYNREFERATEQVESGAISENAFITSVNAIGVAMRTAKASVVLQLSKQEWSNFINAG